MRAAIAERIGTCELCGLTDHHLVDGICPGCRIKSTAVSASATAPCIALPPPSLESCGSRGFVSIARGTFAQRGAGARLALANLDMPDDESAGDEAGAPREALR